MTDTIWARVHQWLSADNDNMAHDHSHESSGWGGKGALACSPRQRSSNWQVSTRKVGPYRNRATGVEIGVLIPKQESGR